MDTALEAQFNLIASYVALAIECGAVEECSTRVNLAGLIVHSPVSHCVEVFESKTDRVHRFVTSCADRIFPMLLHTFTQ